MKKMTKKKKLFRKVTALAAVVALGASLAGCGSSGEETTQRYSWPLATASPEDTVTQIFAEKFAEEISELSDGRMKIQVYANSTLGGDRDLLETCADGDIPFVVQNTAPQVSFMGDLAVFDLPCVFDSLDECREKIDNPEFYELISNVYTEGGYHLLGMADQGFRVMSTNKPVYSFSDFKGQKIRTMENNVHLAIWQALGANPSPLAFGELYTALQQGTVDGQENPIASIATSAFGEVQKYMCMDGHTYGAESIIMNLDLYNGMTPEQQAWVDEAAAYARDTQRAAVDAVEAEYLQQIKDGGTIVCEDPDIQSFKDATADMYKLPEVAELVDPSLTEAVMAKVAEFNANK